MIDPKRVRGVMLVAFMEWMPPAICNEFLSDEGLRSDFGLEVDPEINFGDAKVVFKRSRLFAAVRAAGAAPSKAQNVQDQSGTAWQIITSTTPGNHSLVLKSGPRSLNVTHLLLLTKNRGARKQFFAREADRLNLPKALTKHWSRVLDKRSLTDDEIGELLFEESRTPVAMNDRIVEHLRQPNISIEVLVPRSVDYYERLVGRIEGQANIKEFAEKVATDHIHHLLAWRVPDGLHQVLLMCSHSLMTSILAKETVSATEFDRLAKWAHVADAIARTATLELAIERSRDKAKIGESVRALAKRFAGHGDKERDDPFTLLSAAFVMVDGELAKRKLLVSKPPFWRRLAALSHAALIARCVLSTPGEHSKFIGWMRSVRSDEYIAQGFADLRREPRWLAEFAWPRQLKDELGGRVLAAAARDEKATDKLGLRNILIGSQPGSLRKQLNLLSIQFPGPLEGNVELVTPLPPDLLVKMREQLADPSPAVSSFILLANSALIFRVPEDVPYLAAEALRRAQYRLDCGGKPEQLQHCLMALATVAASYRNCSLADELFMVIRSNRRFLPEEMDLDDAIRIGMIACASRSEVGDWCKSVGALLTDLAFGQLTREEAGKLHPFLINLCELVPQLWAACGQALAAIEAVGWGRF
jgi:hypothetical protein